MANKRGIPAPKLHSRRNNIPVTAAVNRELTDTDDRKIVFSFSDYRSSLCEIDSLPEATARKALRQIKNMGMAANGDLQSANVRPRKVTKTNKGDYSKLYLGLTPEVTIWEFNISSGGRCFYYRVGNVVFVRAFRENHLRT